MVFRTAIRQQGLEFTSPEVEADTPLDVIAKRFFDFDCVKINGLLSPDFLSFFRVICERQYNEDDGKFDRGEISDPSLLRQYQNGWIWEDRFLAATSGAFSFNEIIANRRLYQIIDRLIGSEWKTATPSQIRRAHPERHASNWGSHTTFHLDAQWGDKDKTYMINVWVPLTPCGRTAPGLEFLINDPAVTLRYAQYDPAKPQEPRGPGGINPRFNYDLFRRQELDKHFVPEQFWTPEFNLGDIIIFSHWAPHATYVEPRMTNTRISLEWRVSLSSFDTPLRQTSIQF